MIWLLAAIAQALHGGLMLLVAPGVGGLPRCIEARLAGRAGPPPLQPWRDLIRLTRKQSVGAENASTLLPALPPAVLAATMLAVFLVPSFATGMLFGGMADLLLLTGLIGLSRALLALAALDAGTAAGGVAAARTMSRACLVEPAMLLAILALGALGGTTNLDRLVGLQRAGMLQPASACALAVLALAAVMVASTEPPDLLSEFSGVDLAIMSLAKDLRRLFWLDLLAAVFLPIGMADATAGPIAWAVGLAAWALKIALLTGAWAMVRRATGHRRRASLVAGAAGVLGLLATVMALASAAAV